MNPVFSLLSTHAPARLLAAALCALMAVTPVEGKRLCRGKRYRRQAPRSRPRSIKRRSHPTSQIRLRSAPPHRKPPRRGSPATRTPGQEEEHKPCRAPPPRRPRPQNKAGLCSLVRTSAHGSAVGHSAHTRRLLRCHRLRPVAHRRGISGSIPCARPRLHPRQALCRCGRAICIRQSESAIRLKTTMISLPPGRITSRTRKPRLKRC